jgi:hypothetical protein
MAAKFRVGATVGASVVAAVTSAYYELQDSNGNATVIPWAHPNANNFEVKDVAPVEGTVARFRVGATVKNVFNAPSSWTDMRVEDITDSHVELSYNQAGTPVTRVFPWYNTSFSSLQVLSDGGDE